MLYVLKTGIPWADLPQRFGKPKTAWKRRKRYDRQRYKHRNVIERFFRRIKQCRRIATRYDKKADNFAGFVWLAAGITTPGDCP